MIGIELPGDAAILGPCGNADVTARASGGRQPPGEVDAASSCGEIVCGFRSGLKPSPSSHPTHLVG